MDSEITNFRSVTKPSVSRTRRGGGERERQEAIREMERKSRLISFLTDPLLKRVNAINSSAYRLSAFENIFNKQIDIENCNGLCTPFNYLKLTKILSKTSASDTVLGFADIQVSNQYLKIPFDAKVTMKLSFASLYNDNSLDIEIRAYSIINKLMENKNTPNFLPMIYAFKCKDFHQQLNNVVSLQGVSQFYKELLKAIEGIPAEGGVPDDQLDPSVFEVDSYGKKCRRQFLHEELASTATRSSKRVKMAPSPSQMATKKFKCKKTPVTDIIYDLNCARILLLEKANGQSLSDFLKGQAFTREDINSIMFQMIYTLTCMNQSHFQHNDLHPGNLFIDYADPSDPNETIELTYQVSRDRYYKINTRYIVKLFDFDQAYIKGIKNTKLDLLDFCEDYGICNVENPKFDLYIVLFWILRINRGLGISQLDEVESFIYRNVERNLMDYQEWPFAGRLCRRILDAQGNFIPDPEAPGKVKCDGAWIPSDSLMKPPGEMLGDDYFDKYLSRYPPADDLHLYRLPRLL